MVSHMLKMGKTEYIAFRVPESILGEIQARIEAGEFSGKSDFAYCAVRFYLDYLKRMENKSIVSIVKTFDE